MLLKALRQNKLKQIWSVFLDTELSFTETLTFSNFILEFYVYYLYAYMYVVYGVGSMNMWVPSLWKLEEDIKSPEDVTELRSSEIAMSHLINEPSL